ncbi:hypothetical protein GALL_498620 [mine drainage metagenome]|uniref:Hemerythrin-like domain-containing protein n=1 Tax=mine drainage metagenome TaxID=410659 RepID=A0A1J5PL82_9ZZZZ
MRAGQGVGEGGVDAAGDASQHLVRQPGHRVLLVQHQPRADQRAGAAAHAGDAGHPDVAVGQARVAPGGVDDVVVLAGDAHHRAAVAAQHARGAERGVGRGQAVDAACGRRRAGHADDLGRVAAQHVGLAGRAQRAHRVTPVGGGADPDRIEHHRRAARARRAQRQRHRFNPVGLQRADVEHDGAGQRGHRLDFLACVRHHRRRTGGEQQVRGEVHHHQIGHVVHQRAARPQREHVVPQVLGTQHRGLLVIASKPQIVRCRGDRALDPAQAPPRRRRYHRRMAAARSPAPSPTLAAELLDEHAAMLQMIGAVRVALLRGAIAQAREQLARLGEQQARHIACENDALIARLPAGARWTARVYLAEHDKLERMHAELVALLAPLPPQIDDAALQLRLLDAHTPFKHLLEHHFEREQQGLFVEVGRAAEPR